MISRARLLAACGPAALAAWMAAAPARAQDAPAASAAPRPTPAEEDLRATEVEELVVTAARREQPGAVIGDIPPEEQLSAAEIRSLGVSNVAELLDAIAPLTGSSRGRGGGRPVMLVNGVRISSFAEVRDLPPEAILRVDILPEEVALKYGYRADQRVVNLVLRPRFRAVTAEVGASAPTAGGRDSLDADLNLLHIQQSGRLQIDLKASRTTPLLESDRDVVREPDPLPVVGTAPDEAPFRSLADATEAASINTVYTRTLGEGVSATLNGSLASTQSERRLGLPGVSVLLPAANPFSPFGPDTQVQAWPGPLRPLTRTSDVLDAHLGGAMNGAWSGWRWSLTGNADRTDTETTTETGLDPSALQAALSAGQPIDPADPPPALLPGRAPDLAHSVVTSADGQATAHGTLFKVPAGDLGATFTVAFAASRFDSSSLRRGAARNSSLSRDLGRLAANFDAPLTSRRKGAPPGIGDLSASLNLGVQQLSDFGRLTNVDAGLNWSPIEPLRLIASVTEEDGAPTVQQLGGPETATPNVRVFDFTRGETVEVTRIDGGNPDLGADRRRVLKLGMTLKPFDETELTIRADYTRSRVEDAIAAFPAATPEIESAFPGRFVRDGEGRLVQIDARPVNFAREDKADLRWGFYYSKRIGQAAQPRGRGEEGPPRREGGPPGRGPGGPGGFGRGRFGVVQLSIFDTVHLQDEVLIRPGVPVLDFLNGSAAGNGGGQPRHEVELRAGVMRNGLGARLEGNWRSATEVDGGPTGGQDLRFSDLATLNVRLFADLGAQPIAREHRWLRGARMSLEVNNLFDARQEVTTAAGVTPVSYQPDLIDPVGRTVRFSLRKVFF